MRQGLSGVQRSWKKLCKIRANCARRTPLATRELRFCSWVGWSVGELIAIDLSKGRMYWNWLGCILSAFGWSVGGVRNEGKNPSAALVNTGFCSGVGSFGLFESPAACGALLRWAGLEDVQSVDYHALRERDIERLADLVDKHLDGALLRGLCGLENN